MNPQHSDEDTIGADVVLREVPAGTALSTPEEARQRAEEIRGHLTLGFGKLTLAREKRDDLALGYPSWHAYLSGEYGDYSALGLPMSEREHVVESLRVDAGLSQRVIAGRLGTSVATVYEDLRRRGVTVTEVRGADGKVYTKPQRAAEPAAPFVRTEGMSKRAEVVARIRHAGPHGMTCLEIESRKATGWRHGIASSPLSAVAQQGKVVRSGAVREGYAVWVTPEHAVIDAELVEDEEGSA